MITITVKIWARALVRVLCAARWVDQSQTLPFADQRMFVPTISADSPGNSRRTLDSSNHITECYAVDQASSRTPNDLIHTHFYAAVWQQLLLKAQSHEAFGVSFPAQKNKGQDKVCVQKNASTYAHQRRKMRTWRTVCTGYK
jgi:hypothetical protein